jgi:hypothetical protein
MNGYDILAEEDTTLPKFLVSEDGLVDSDASDMVFGLSAGAGMARLYIEDENVMNFPRATISVGCKAMYGCHKALRARSSAQPLPPGPDLQGVPQRSTRGIIDVLIYTLANYLGFRTRHQLLQLEYSDIWYSMALS